MRKSVAELLEFDSQHLLQSDLQKLPTDNVVVVQHIEELRECPPRISCGSGPTRGHPGPDMLALHPPGTNRLVGVRPQGSKDVRAIPAATRMEAGQVFFPAEAPWLDDLEHELLSFPNGR